MPRLRPRADPLEPRGGRPPRRRPGGRRASDRVKNAADTHRAKLEDYEALCAESGDRPGGVALAWLLSRPGVTSRTIGPRTLEQLDHALAAIDLTLDDAVLERLDKIFPVRGARRRGVRLIAPRSSGTARGPITEIPARWRRRVGACRRTPWDITAPT